MDKSLVTRVLADHGIRVRIFNGRMQAEDIATVLRPSGYRAKRAWTTIDGWKCRQLLNWLGY